LGKQGRIVKLARKIPSVLKKTLVNFKGKVCRDNRALYFKGFYAKRVIKKKLDIPLGTVKKLE